MGPLYSGFHAVFSLLQLLSPLMKATRQSRCDKMRRNLCVRSHRLSLADLARTSGEISNLAGWWNKSPGGPRYSFHN